jgi:hypothetical protein
MGPYVETTESATPTLLVLSQESILVRRRAILGSRHPLSVRAGYFPNITQALPGKSHWENWKKRLVPPRVSIGKSLMLAHR